MSELRRYAKPVVVAESLDELRGPAAGIVTLPHHLDWSGSPHHDLDQPGQLAECYRMILNEAMHPDDLHRHLDRVNLTRLWPSLWLPPYLREAWEQRFPELRPSTAGPAAA